MKFELKIPLLNNTQQTVLIHQWLKTNGSWVEMEEPVVELKTEYGIWGALTSSIAGELTIIDTEEPLFPGKIIAEVHSLSNVVKMAHTEYPVLDVIRERWSARAFSEQRVTEMQLYTLFEAASWAASSMNEQPWEYRYAFQGDAGYDLLASSLFPGNALWATQAPVILLSLARTKHQNGNPNPYAWHDVGAANANLMLQATAMGLVGHLMGGFDRHKIQALLNLPLDLEPVVLIVLGYPGNPDNLQEPFLSREKMRRTRNKINEFAYRIK